jgi:excisionase family DNA binding protein
VSETAPQLLTRRDAAKLLALSESKLEKLTAAGELPVVRIGRAVRYDLVDLRGWIAERKTPAALAR